MSSERQFYFWSLTDCIHTHPIHLYVSMNIIHIYISLGFISGWWRKLIWISRCFREKKAPIINSFEISETDSIVPADSSQGDVVCCRNWFETDGKRVDWTKVISLLSKYQSRIGLSNLQAWFSDVCCHPPYLSVSGCHFSHLAWIWDSSWRHWKPIGTVKKELSKYSTLREKVVIKDNVLPVCDRILIMLLTEINNQSYCGSV